MLFRINYETGETAFLDAWKGTYMADMIAPTKRAPKVSPRDGIACEDISGYKETVASVLVCLF